MKDQCVKHYRFPAKARLFDTSVSLNCTRAADAFKFAVRVTRLWLPLTVRLSTNERMRRARTNDKGAWQKHRQRGKAGGTSLLRYILYNPNAC